MSNVTLSEWSLMPNVSTELSVSSPAVLFLKSAALGLMVALTVGGNLLVMLAVLAAPCGGLVHRSPTHLLIANLAGADLLLGAAVLPLSAARELAGGAWHFGRAWCAIWAAADVLCCTASILSLCGISVDRYIGVTRPLAYSGIMTKRRACLMIMGIWLLAMVISIGPPLGWRDTTPAASASCEVNKQLAYVIFSVVGSFYAPMLVIVVLYYQVYRAVVTRSRVLQDGSETLGGSQTPPLRVHVCNGQQLGRTPALRVSNDYMSHRLRGTVGYRVHASRVLSSKFKRQKKAAQTLAIVVGGFLVCWLPFFIILPIDSACSSCGLSDLPFTLAFWLGYFNSCINPFIYACSSHELRRAFRYVLCCGARPRRGTSHDKAAMPLQHLNQKH